MIVSATILAAGSSSRMGEENKLLLPVNGIPMIRQVVSIGGYAKYSRHNIESVM